MGAVLCLVGVALERDNRTGDTADENVSGLLTALTATVEPFFAPAGAYLLLHRERLVWAFAGSGLIGAAKYYDNGAYYFAVHRMLAGSPINEQTVIGTPRPLLLDNVNEYLYPPIVLVLILPFALLPFGLNGGAMFADRRYMSKNRYTQKNTSAIVALPTNHGRSCRSLHKRDTTVMWGGTRSGPISGTGEETADRESPSSAWSSGATGTPARSWRR